MTRDPETLAGAPEKDPLVESSADGDRPARTFRATLVRVMGVQIVALLILWALQARYS